MSNKFIAYSFELGQNPDAMERKTTYYVLEISELQKPYDGEASLENSTRVDTLKSKTPFGAFAVGDTLSHGRAMKFLGEIQHVNHMIGEIGENEILHTLRVYYYPGAE